MNTTTSPSSIVAVRPSGPVMAVACTNSSVSPRAYAASSAAAALCAVNGARPSTSAS
jgi:hypothetical protein